MIVIETMREQLFSLQAINLRISDEMFNTQNYNLKQMQASFRISTYRLLPVKYDKHLLIIKFFLLLNLSLSWFRCMFKIHIFKIKEEEMMYIGLLLWGNIKYKIKSLPEVQTIVSIWNFLYDFDKEKFVTITFTCRSSFLC